jgi:sugar/nucleoside kinase (ribokinase family)
MKKPLIVGAVYTEIVNEVDVLPKGNEDFIPKRTEMRTAGAGYTMARILNGFGFPYELLASAGTGTYGEQVKETCRNENIPLQEKEGINGCMYTLVDAAGNEGYMCVPGVEYDFDLEDIEYLDTDEISFIVLFGEMLTGPHAMDLIQALDDLQKPMIFVPNNRGDEIEEDLMHAVFQFEPELFLSDTEAYFIAGATTKEMKDTADLLAQESEAPVYIVQQGTGLYYQDQKDAFFVEETKKVKLEHVLAGYLASRIAGVDTHRGLAYAVSFAKECRNKMPSGNLLEMEKRILADLILGKK